MGIYISGINLPRGKHSIVEITITEDGTVFTGSTDTFHKSDLRAVEIPSRHGRLIDADALKKKWVFTGIAQAGERDEIENAPVVIEAEEKE